ncbi:hypothetical protein D3C84_1114700 [compost metagenome]
MSGVRKPPHTTSMSYWFRAVRSRPAAKISNPKSLITRSLPNDRGVILNRLFCSKLAVTSTSMATVKLAMEKFSSSTKPTL